MGSPGPLLLFLLLLGGCRGGTTHTGGGHSGGRGCHCVLPLGLSPAGCCVLESEASDCEYPGVTGAGGDVPWGWRTLWGWGG